MKEKAILFQEAPSRHQVGTKCLNPLIDAGLLEMTIPDKPRSSKQRYRTTVAGLMLLTKLLKEDRG